MGMGGSASQKSTGWSTGESESQIEMPQFLQPLAEQTASNVQWFQDALPLWKFMGENPLEVAPADELQNWVSENVRTPWETPGTRGQALDYVSKAVDFAGKRATGEGIETSPAVLKASEAFDKLMLPQIENQMGLAGLGKSSSLGNAMATGKTTYMLPMIQDELAREQATYQNQAAMYAGMVPQLEGMGTSDASRQFATLNAAASQGGTMRGIAQEPLTAAYQDFLRRQALSEQALFLPFGATSTAAIGPHATASQESQQSSSGKQSQGLFK